MLYFCGEAFGYYKAPVLLKGNISLEGYALNHVSTWHVPREEMRKVSDEEAAASYLSQVVGAACTMGAEAILSLYEQLQYLDSYACHDEDDNSPAIMRAVGRPYTRCVLARDFAPFSFSFNMLKRNEENDYEHWFNGGLIYSGPAQPLDGSGPALTVSLDPSCRDGSHRWSVHT